MFSYLDAYLCNKYEGLDVVKSQTNNNFADYVFNEELNRSFEDDDQRKLRLSNNIRLTDNVNSKIGINNVLSSNSKKEQEDLNWDNGDFMRIFSSPKIFNNTNSTCSTFESHSTQIGINEECKDRSKFFYPEVDVLANKMATNLPNLDKNDMSLIPSNFSCREGNVIDCDINGCNAKNHSYSDNLSNSFKYHYLNKNSELGVSQNKNDYYNLKGKEIADKLIFDLLNDLDPKCVVDESINLLEHSLLYLCSIKYHGDFYNDTTNSESCIIPKFELGTQNYSTPVILAHPDEFKNPSSFLKIYGDPLCRRNFSNSISNPTKGQCGNWPCKKCNNVNFPRRFRCFKCGEYRGDSGNKIVSEYAKNVYLYHLKAYKNRNFNVKRQKT